MTQPLRIAWVYDLNACRGPTGVTRHALAMRAELAAMPGVELSVVTGQLRNDEARADWESLSGTRRHSLPLTMRNLLRYWRVMRVPVIERWTGPVDWVYCPAEYGVPARRARRAVTSHDVWQDLTIGGPRRRLLLHRVLGGADLVLSVSEFNTRRLLEHYPIDAKRVELVPNAAEELFFERATEVERAAARRAAGLASGQPYLLSVANFQPRKNLPFLIEALAGLPEVARGEMALVLVGEGSPEQRRAIEAACGRGDLRVEVRLPGYQEGPALRALYAGASALVFPSHCESFGIPVVEAMAQGCPVALADTTALPEVGGGAGWYFSPTDAESLRAAVRCLLDDEEERNRRCVVGRDRAGMYRWSESARRLVAALGKGT